MYNPPGFNMERASSSNKYFPCQVSAKMKSNFRLRLLANHSAPSVNTTVNLLSLPKCCCAIVRKASSLSIETKVECSSIPSRIQEADKPVPVPSSRNLPAGLEAARVRKSVPVSGSDAIVKPEALVAISILEYDLGKVWLIDSFMFV